jgi:glycosyltransferase involved in cell wall biosynthesis
MKRISIAFITADDPRDKRSWSGTNHFMYKALEKNIGIVDLLGPYTPQPQKFFCSAFNYISIKLFGKRFDYRHSRMMRKAYGKHFTALLAKKKYDLIIVSASTASAAGIKTNIPIIYINDRVIPGAIGYHKILTDLYYFSEKQSIQTDKLAIENSFRSVFSSHWAADAAINFQGANPEKIKVLPFGANFERFPSPPKNIPFPAFPIRLLFVGVNWEDKGGYVAYDTLLHLNKIGIDTELIIIGCTPPGNFFHPKMKVVGFLNKNNPEEFEQLLDYFRTSHFFILPTKFEAYGLVFCESAAYGLPALAPATGGIPTIIENNVTGFLLPEKAEGKDYAEKIEQLIKNPDQWKAMRNAAYKRYTEKLNWESWSEGFKKILEESGIRF